MKIETHSNLHVTNVTTPTSSKSDKVTEKSPSNAEKVSNTNTRARMLGWFAQAGIRPTGSFNHQEVDREAIRRRQISAQRKVQNLQKILDLALDFSTEQSKADALDPDWFFSFISMAEDIYSPAMQELWGKIFAVEIARAGSFSLRSLQTLKQLTQRDAKMFYAASCLVSKRVGEHSAKILYGYYQKPSVWSFLGSSKLHQLNLAHFGLPYPDLLALMEMGLIYRSEIESGELDPQHATQWRCGSGVLNLVAKRRGITLNYYKFTPTGEELLRLVNPKPNMHYLDELKVLLNSGFLLS